MGKEYCKHGIVICGFVLFAHFKKVKVSILNYNKM